MVRKLNTCELLSYAGERIQRVPPIETWPILSDIICNFCSSFINIAFLRIVERFGNQP